jgi:hypothetical protein
MRIGRKPTKRLLTPNRLRWVGFLLIFTVGVFLGQRGLWTVLTDSWSTAISDWQAGRDNDDLPTLIIDMPFANYNAILAQRDEAVATAVFIATESDFQPATIRLADQVIPVRLRLQQGTAVHLGDDDKWNLDIRTRDNQLLLGMQRFYLIDPADNNWQNEWAFLETLRREDILASRYQFVRLVFNGTDRGIYALQEGFGLELPADQGRPPGIIVEFDATRLWQAAAAAGDAAVAEADPVTNLAANDFRFFEVDTFRDASIASDDILAAQKDAAIGLLRGLQSGELAAADVFDVARYGRFLALADLWGASEAVSLVNLRYYYHPETGKLEPIGFNAAPLPADNSRRISLDATYNDLDLQAAYVQAMQQISHPQYLAELQASLEPEWQTRTQLLRGVHAQPPPWEALARRQELLRQSLSPAQPVFAYLGPPELSINAVIQVDVANVLNLPVEILGFDIDGATFLEADPAWLQEDWQPLLLDDSKRIILKPVDADTAVLHYARFHLPLTQIIAQDDELDFNQEITISVATRLWGLDEPQLTAARPGYPDPIGRLEAGSGID